MCGDRVFFKQSHGSISRFVKKLFTIFRLLFKNIPRRFWPFLFMLSGTNGPTDVAYMFLCIPTFACISCPPNKFV